MQPDLDSIMAELTGVAPGQIDRFKAGARLDHDTNPAPWHATEYVAWRNGRGLAPCPFCSYGSGGPGAA